MPWEDAIHLSRESDGGIAVELPQYPLNYSGVVEVPKPYTASGSIEGDELYLGIKSPVRRLLVGIRRAVTRPPRALARRVKSLRYRYVAPLSGSMSLGVTEPVSITAESTGSEYPGLAPFIADATARFVVMHLACSFDPFYGERFLKASLAVALWRADGRDEPAPIAWSMEPHCLRRVTEISRSQKLDASLKFVSLSLGGEERTTRTECLVQAFNELQSNPRWDFRRAPGAEILGTQRLIMVVQTQGAARADIKLTARVQRKGLRMRRPVSLQATKSRALA